LQPEAPSIEIDCKCNQSSWQRRLARKQKQSKRPFFPKNKHQRELLQVASKSNGGLDCMPIQLTPVIAAKQREIARKKLQIDGLTLHSLPHCTWKVTKWKKSTA